nr:hypothetical protein CFP56_58821 [Quercus suber]
MLYMLRPLKAEYASIVAFGGTDPLEDHPMHFKVGSLKGTERIVIATAHGTYPSARSIELHATHIKHYRDCGDVSIALGSILAGGHVYRQARDVTDEDSRPTNRDTTVRLQFSRL